MLRNFSFLVLFLSCLLSFGQSIPLGTWQVHAPYSSSSDVVVAGNKVWGICEAAVIAIDREDFSITRYTKASGLSDVNLAAIAYDETTEAIVIAYENANVDIIQNGGIVNIPAIKNAIITGDKTINNIHSSNGFAWLACGFGIVKLNIAEREISDTYFVGIGNSNLQINDIWADNAFVFAATEEGVIRGKISPFINLSNADDPNAWFRYNFETHQLLEVNSSTISEYNGSIYVAQSDEIHRITYDGIDETWEDINNETDWNTVSILNKNGKLFLSQNLLNNENIVDTRIGSYNGNSFSFIQDNGQIQRPQRLDVDEEGIIWYGDLFAGVSRIENNVVDRFVPNGPYKSSVLGMAYHNETMYISSSSMNPTLPGGYPFLPYGFYASTQQNWFNYNEFNMPGLAGTFDLAVIEPIPAENKLLIGAHNSGVIEFDLDDNSVEIFEKPVGESNTYRCIGMQRDDAGNVWLSNAYANDVPLVCRKPDGTYINFTQKTTSLLGRPINYVEVDDFNQIWLSTAGSGVYVYNYNGTLEDESDDILKNVGTNFNLPSTDVRCIANDQDGEIWIGTATGIGVVFCPGSIINNNCIVDRICIPREDTTNFCDNLLENEVVNCIAIDPGNRKWIGTNGGIFLQSASGLETVHHFTTDNSPLISNTIRSVAIDEKTGDVYIGTDKGINTYRADAILTIEGKSGEPYVYPNPVRPEYRGPIAIANLPNNASVKIVDVGGNIVYETESVGGLATWDGYDINGDRVHSGVYIVLSADEDGGQKTTTKFVFIH